MADMTETDYNTRRKSLLSTTQGSPYERQRSVDILDQTWKQQQKRINTDNGDQGIMNNFASTENNIALMPGQTDLTSPDFYGTQSADLKKKADLMSTIFSARKDEILKRQAAPGIMQTRFDSANS